jgi:hypothetical protein
MPALVTISVVSIAGLDRLTKRFRGQQHIFCWVGVIFLSAFLFTEWYPNAVLGGRPAVDWKPGAGWNRTKPFRSRGEKLGVLAPALQDLELWNARPRGTEEEGDVWGEPMTIAALDPWQIDGGGRWMDWLEPGGVPAWKKGDYVLLTTAQRTAVKPRLAVIDRLLEEQAHTWGDWIELVVSQGLLRKESSYPSLTVYQFCLSPEEVTLSGPS